MTTITNAQEMFDFVGAVMDAGQDPASYVCQMFVSWGAADGRDESWGAEWNIKGNCLMLELPDNGDVRCFPLEVSVKEPEAGLVNMRYQMRKICLHVWAMAPSWNVPGVIHAFLVFHGVPEPAPWEQLVILVEGF